jgi:hypothetical protein
MHAEPVAVVGTYLLPGSTPTSLTPVCYSRSGFQSACVPPSWQDVL